VGKPDSYWDGWVRRLSVRVYFFFSGLGGHWAERRGAAF